VRVKVIYTSIFRESSGRREEEWVLDEGSTLRDLISRLAARYGGEFRQMLRDGDIIDPDYIIFVNDGVVRDLSHRLKDGDTIIFTVAIGGGIYKFRQSYITKLKFINYIPIHKIIKRYRQIAQLYSPSPYTFTKKKFKVHFKKQIVILLLFTLYKKEINARDSI
jgi:MoaD family protein